MYGPDKFRLAKELTRSFVSAMPEGKYRAGMLSFGGEWTNEWVRQEPVPLDRDLLLNKTSQLTWLRGSTPFAVTSPSADGSTRVMCVAATRSR